MNKQKVINTIYGQYTGDVHVAEITYITDYAQQDGYVVLGIKWGGSIDET